MEGVVHHSPLQEDILWDWRAEGQAQPGLPISFHRYNKVKLFVFTGEWQVVP